jgi:hypothetical protein
MEGQALHAPVHKFQYAMDVMRSLKPESLPGDISPAVAIAVSG